MKQVAFVLLLGACSKSEPSPPVAAPAVAPPVTAPPPVVVDAAVPIVDAFEDPDPSRKGKKAGLIKGELPEVVTEDLVRALAVGNIDVAAFIDPKRGLFDKEDVPGAGDKPVRPQYDKRFCGADAVAAARRYLKRMLAEEVAGKGKTPDDSVHVITCSNMYVEQPDAHFGSMEGYDDPGGKTPIDMGHSLAYASCESPSIMEWNEGFHLIFTPDAKRGFALVGIVSTEGGAMTYHLWNEVAKALTAPKACS